MPDKKPWEEDVFGVGKGKKKKRPGVTMQQAGDALAETPVGAAESTAEALKRRNRELTKLYGEPKK